MHSFEQALRADWPAEKWQEHTVLLAVSGGADSVALLRAMTADGSHRQRIVVAHFNHQWRGNESDDDEQFVVDLAGRLGLLCHVGRPEPTSTGLANARTEEAARDLRYRFLTATADQVGARYVATAHTADDQIETVLQRVLRGVGLAGLAGIPRLRQLSASATLIRPMLNVRRSQVMDYLETIGQPFRTDSSNADQAFARNRIRHELLPLARELYSGADESLLRLSKLAAEEQQRLSAAVGKLLDQAVRSIGEHQVAIDSTALASVEPPVIRELLVEVWRAQRWPRQAMGFDQWTTLAEMLMTPVTVSGEATAMLPSAIRAEKKGVSLWLTRPSKSFTTESD